MAITKQMQRELANKARAANRRLERASEGQRRALEHYMKGYSNTREGKYGTVFKQGAAKTEAEYRQRMKELDKFMKGETTTHKGWEALKKRTVEKANEKLKQMGYKYSDAELTSVLEEASPKEQNFYHVLNVVQAFRDATGDDEIDDELIIEALTSRLSDYQLTLATIKSRG